MKLNKKNYINRVSSFGSARIKKEIGILERSRRISRKDKDDIINKLFYKLGSRKQKNAFGFTKKDLLAFGQTPPVTAAVTVAPTTVPAVSAPVTVATPTSVAAPVSVATPVSVPASVVVPPTTVPVAPPPVTQAATTGATIVQSNPYGSIAGATQQLEQAAQQLLQTAAAQNISGFGFQRRRRFY